MWSLLPRPRAKARLDPSSCATSRFRALARRLRRNLCLPSRLRLPLAQPLWHLVRALRRPRLLHLRAPRSRHLPDLYPVPNRSRWSVHQPLKRPPTPASPFHFQAHRLPRRANPRPRFHLPRRTFPIPSSMVHGGPGSLPQFCSGSQPRLFFASAGTAVRRSQPTARYRQHQPPTSCRHSSRSPLRRPGRPLIPNPICRRGSSPLGCARARNLPLPNGSGPKLLPCRQVRWSARA